MANSQPRTGAVIPEAVRLERVRLESEHADSLWEFWKALCEQPPGDVAAKVDDEGNYQISYEAVRNYHHDRHAPGHYYAQVSAVFDVRLEWLLGAGGGMTRTEDSALRAGVEVVDAVRMWPDWTEEQRREARLLHVLLEPEPHVPGVSFLPVPTNHERGAMITFLHSWVRRRGVDFVSSVLTSGEAREPTHHDVVDFYARVFLEPLRAFAVDQQRLAAFHSLMSMMWLQDLAGAAWWETHTPHGTPSPVSPVTSPHPTTRQSSPKTHGGR